MKSKIRGFIDPFSLGILISLIATGAIFATTHKSETTQTEHSATETEVSTSSHATPHQLTDSTPGASIDVD